MENDNVYLNILIDSSKKKLDILNQIIQVEEVQTSCLDKEPFDFATFDRTFLQKDEYIQKLNELDMGFENTYKHIQEEIAVHKEKYKSQILELQQLIRKITELSGRIQMEESKNKTKLQAYSSGKKREIRNLQKSNKTISSYYKNMGDQQAGNSYFLDKKK